MPVGARVPLNGHDPSYCVLRIMGSRIQPLRSSAQLRKGRCSPSFDAPVPSGRCAGQGPLQENDTLFPVARSISVDEHRSPRDVGARREELGPGIQ